MIDPTDIKAEVLASRKYQHIDIGLIESIAKQEATRHRTLKEAVKATKNKLHQVAEVYFTTRPDYTQWAEELHKVAHDPQQTKAACRTILAQHTSTRERIPLLENFYQTIFANLPPIHTLLDLACGFNPLTYPWMGIPASDILASMQYLACDIHNDQVTFLNELWKILGLNGRAFIQDLSQHTPTERADVALLLKRWPCLEQINRQIGLRLLDEIQAPIIIVSFPCQSIGGHHKGMLNHYESSFRALLATRSWQVDRFVFSSELVFRIFK